MVDAEKHLLWPEWPEFLKAQNRCRIIGYGTLINKHSIADTVGAARLEGPATAFGLRRVFSFLLEDTNYVDHGGRYERSSDPVRCATLNLNHTGDPADQVNGIMFSVEPADVDALAEREFGYDLVPVQHDRSEIESATYVFLARKTSQVIGHRVLDSILPNESSIRICLAGAASYGKNFLEAWIGSCYLADDTPLMDDPFYRRLVEEFLAEKGPELINQV